MPEVSLDEQEQEEDEEEPLKPQLSPQGSGGSGVLMGPDTQKGLENDAAQLGLHMHREPLNTQKRFERLRRWLTRSNTPNHKNIETLKLLMYFQT